MLDQNAYLASLASEALDMFSRVASEAASRLKDGPGISLSSISNGDGVHNQAIRQQQARINRESADNYRQLASEPAIARVVTEDDCEQQHVYYICRSGGGIAGLVGRNAPLGRLASLDIEDTFTWQGTVHTLLEKTRFRPRRAQNFWDSVDSVAETMSLGPLTISSLRAFLKGFHPEASEEVIEDLVAQILDAGHAEQQVFQGLRRTVIEKMGFRDQPVLDKFQDEIFRLPLSHQLVMLGPPGTGKTTTLIRRLGQKVNWEVLTEEERDLVETTHHANPHQHASSWLMFTPTELLKQYLKEAFAREGVAAPDSRIQTWQHHRLDLARNHFGILRNGSGRGLFTAREQSGVLQEESLAHPTRWYEDFETWHREHLLEEIREAQIELARVNLPSHAALKRPLAAKDLAKRLESLLKTRTPKDLTSIVEALALGEAQRLEQLVEELKPVAESLLREPINRLLAKDRRLLTDLADFLLTQKPIPETSMEESDEQATEEDEEETPTSQSALQSALQALMGAVRSKIRLGAAQPPKSPGRSSRAGKILAWLEERATLEVDEVTLGPILVAMAQARFLQNPVRRLIDGLPKRYRAFRRERQKVGRWYLPKGFDPRDIHPLEIDLVLLATLREGNQLLQRAHIQAALSKGGVWTPLQAVANQHHNQILVDEATDFSPLQLGCMGALAHPRTQSFFACGDFNQRLTMWGSRSEEALRWAVPNIKRRTVNVAYRQSRQLNELAHALMALSGGADEGADLPKHLNAEGVAPALLEFSDEGRAVAWLAERIQEIERFVGVRSTAVFVNSETEVAAVARQLDAHLAEHNLRAIACANGQALGEDSDIRVFDIQHIKGLEFEAVFFLGIDHLAEAHPDLFDKFLYVGATRAATYLGLTCTGTLPKSLEPLRSHFVMDWQQVPATQPLG